MLFRLENDFVKYRQNTISKEKTINSDKVYCKESVLDFTQNDCKIKYTTRII